MKLASLLFLILLLPLTAMAQGAFLFSPGPEPAPAPAAKEPTCTTNYSKALQLFKVGKDIDLGGVPEFEANFSGMTANNRFVSRRSSIYLNMNINDQLHIEVPLTVCLSDTPKGTVLTAKIITSKAVDPGTTQPNEMVRSALQDPDKAVPREITIKVMKTGNQVVFTGTEVDFEASATLK